MATAYVLIDFENVQPKELDAFSGGGFKAIVFVGASQAKVPTALATRAQVIQIAGNGRNALDMHIAYYIGRLAAADPRAVFHIVSRDSDYDPLIRHLKAQTIACTRWESVAEIHAARAPAAKAAAKPAKAAPKAAAKAKPVSKVAAKPAPGRVDGVIENLEKRPRARPGTVAKLTNTIKSLYRDIADKEVLLIVEELKLRGVIVVDGEKVSYQLS